MASIVNTVLQGSSGTALIGALASSGFANTISNIPLFGFVST